MGMPTVLTYANEAPYPHLDKIRPVVIGAEPVTDDVRRHLFASYQKGDGATRDA
jgi:hypothetical protein